MLAAVLVAAILVLPITTASAQGSLGAALVPPPALQPFADLTPEFPERTGSSFALKYTGAPGTVGTWGGSAAVAGTRGKESYDDDVFFDATLRHRGATGRPPIRRRRDRLLRRAGSPRDGGASAM